MNRKTIFIVTGLVLLFALTAGIRIILLGSSPYVTLGDAPALTGAISQSLGITGKDKSLPVAGKDYTLKDTHYLDNRSWVVVKVAITKTNSEAATIVMQKVDSTYHIIAGPGTAFSVTDTQNLPTEVTQFLRQSGVVIYEP